MNSKKLCCICVLFSLLAGCASESSIDEKKKKAQVTQSNINKNTPQQLTDKDLFGNETTLAVSEEDIQAALDGDEFRVPLNSPVILVQSRTGNHYAGGDAKILYCFHILWYPGQAKASDL